MEEMDEFSEDWSKFVTDLNSRALNPEEFIPEEFRDESGLGICIQCGKEGLARKFWNERGGHCRGCSMKEENLHIWKK